jgi:hypothetical protein
VASTFSRAVDVFVQRSLSPQEQAAELANIARQGVADLIQSGRASRRYKRIVDGHEGASESSVKAGGVIVYRFEYLAEALVFALAFLKERSPRGETGRYRDSFYLGLDGRFVKAADYNPATMGDVQEAVVGNTAPYSRKVQVQRAGNKPLHFDVPPGLFDDAARAVNSRFGNIFTAKAYRTVRFPGQYRIKETQVRTGTHGRVKRWAGQLVDSPAIIITAR